MADKHGFSHRQILNAGGVLVASVGLSARANEADVEASPGPPIAPEWSSFCRALERLGALIPEDADPLTRAEGLRCLTRLVALGFDRFVEYADPRHPGFFDLQTAVRKYMGDNPDQTYRVARVEGKGTYRVSGNLAGAAGATLGVYAGSFRSDARQGGGRRLVGQLDERTLEPDAEGNFSATLSLASMEGPSIRLDADANYALIRTYFWDRELRSQHAMPSIERLDVAGPAPPLELDDLMRGLTATVAYVEGSLMWWETWQRRQQPRPKNKLVPMRDDGTIQTPSNVAYLRGRAVLEEDEALLVEIEPRDEPAYWNILLQNVWGESGDWRDRTTSLNNRELERDEQGKVRVVVARQPLDLPNVLDMAGHRENQLSLRWRGHSPLPEATCRVVKVAQLLG